MRGLLWNSLLTITSMTSRVYETGIFLIRRVSGRSLGGALVATGFGETFEAAISELGSGSDVTPFPLFSFWLKSLHLSQHRLCSDCGYQHYTGDLKKVRVEYLKLFRLKSLFRR